MKTTYNPVDEKLVKNYLDGLVPKVFKLLPMKEENNDTLEVYHESLMLELTGFSRVFVEYSDSQDFVSLISSLESLMTISELPKYKRKVFECINLVKKMAK